MNQNSTLPKIKILSLLCLLILGVYNSQAQTRVYASSVPAAVEVDNQANAIDQNLSTRARVRASSGVVVGVGAYSGHIDLQFGTTVLPANTTTYVKIATDQNLLQFLLGGSLGTLLANVGGAVLIGNQEFTVEAFNGSNTTPVLTGQSQIASTFSGDRLRVIRNAANDFYLMITPSQPYNRIRLTNRLGSLVGLGTTVHLDVYDAFYVTAAANCGTAAYTSFSGTGISLDLLQAGSAGVANPNFAIDADATNHSTLSLGLLGVAASVEQTVYFEGPSNATDQFNVRLRLAQTLVDLNLAQNITIIASNGGTVVSTQTLSSLLTLNLLTLQGGTPTNIPISPGGVVDRITVRFSGLASVSVAQNLDFFGAVRNPAPPAITSPGGVSAQVCSGATASLVATTAAGNQLRWYSSATSTTPLATVASGTAYVTPALTATTTYYVSAFKTGCPEESSRVAVTVTVTTVGTPTTANTTQQFCASANPTIANLQVNEANVVFYAAATGGTALATSTALTNGTIYYAAVQGANGCESTTRLAITVNLTALCGVTLNLKVMLQGALFNATGGLMRDNLRQQGLIPLNQPYSSALNARFTHVGGGGTEATTQAVLDANAGTGNAIVDWVFVEIRSASNQQTVIRTASALLQRDGDIVSPTGGAFVIDALPATFYVSVKHRNHFGALSTQLQTVSGGQVTLDFTTITNANLYAQTGYTGADAMATVGSARALFAGNANFDNLVKYDGVANDRQTAAAQVLTHPGNAGQLLNYANANIYASGDINLDGRVSYDGANNDRQLMLNIVVTYPLNTGTLINYSGVSEQIPQ